MVKIQGDCAVFRFYRPGARNVYLAGDFNHWNPHELQLTPAGDGYWQTSMQLAPGSYRFRYYADGQWFSDYAAFGVAYGPYGADSILLVPERPATTKQAPAEPVPAPLKPPTAAFFHETVLNGLPEILSKAKTALALIQAA